METQAYTRKSEAYTFDNHLKSIRMIKGKKHLIIDCQSEAQFKTLPDLLAYGGGFYRLVSWDREYRECLFIEEGAKNVS